MDHSQGTLVVVVKEIGMAPEVKIIPKDFREMQNLVGGPFEYVSLKEAAQTGRTLLLVMNETGALQGLKPNLRFPGVPGGKGVIVGNVFVVADAKKDFGSLNPSEIDRAINFLQDHAIFLYDEDKE